MTENEAIKNQTVSALMVPGERRWDEDLVKDIFTERDDILSIPISDNVEDKWYWRKERYGQYSVKSAYIFMQESKPQSNLFGNSDFWKRMWNLQIPPKIKTFMWRAITGCLPTKDALRVKHVNVTVECPLCNYADESVAHVFLKCSFASLCWNAMGFDTNDSEHESFGEWVSGIFNQWSSEKHQLGATLCWTIWKCRNDLV